MIISIVVYLRKLERNRLRNFTTLLRPVGLNNKI